MVKQVDLNRVFTKMRGDEHEVSPYDSNFIAFAELQTQLMLKMRDLLIDIDQGLNQQLITQNAIWERLPTWPKRAKPVTGLASEGTS